MPKFSLHPAGPVDGDDAVAARLVVLPAAVRARVAQVVGAAVRLAVPRDAGGPFRKQDRFNKKPLFYQNIASVAFSSQITSLECRKYNKSLYIRDDTLTCQSTYNHPNAQSPRLQYWKSSLPRTTKKFQFGLMYLLGLCIALAVYFPVTRTPSWETFLGMYARTGMTLANCPA